MLRLLTEIRKRNGQSMDTYNSESMEDLSERKSPSPVHMGHNGIIVLISAKFHSIYCSFNPLRTHTLAK